MIKRLFGKGDEKSDKRIEKELEQIKSGEVNKIYPILKPGDWVGIKAGCVRQTLFGSPEEPELVIAFGYDAPTNFIFLTHQDIEGKDPQKILTEAFENLEAFESPFAVSSTMDRKVLTASGKDFSSEKILDRKQMLKAHEILGAKELLVSIPRRTCMMITDRAADKEILNQFVYLHNHTWNDDSYGNAPICNALFVVIDGQIDGMIPMGDK